MELACLMEAHLGPPEEPSALERVTELFSVSFHRWKDFSDFLFSPSVLGASGFQHPSEARGTFKWGSLALAFSPGGQVWPSLGSGDISKSIPPLQLLQPSPPIPVPDCHQHFP